MKKIGILSQVYKPEMGAAPNRLHEMATGLKSLGWEVSVITSMPNYPLGKIFDGYRAKFRLTEYLDEIEIRRYWLYPSNSKRPILRLLNWISFSFSVLFSLPYMRKKKFQYLLVQSPPMLVGLSALLLSRLSGSKMILNVSDVWPLTAKELGAISEGSLYRLFERIERRLYSKSYLCLGQSREIVDHLTLHGAIRTYLFHNGVDPSRFRPSKNSGLPQKSRIVYTGLLGVAQGIVDICKNIDFSELGVEFHIYGAGIEQKELEEFLAVNPDRGVFYHGQVHRDKIPEEITKYTATIVPLVQHLYGAVPSKIYESMAAGLPVLYSGDGEAVDIIHSNNLGWTSPPRDYIALKENIKQLGSNREEVTKKGKNCIQAANELFNRNILIEKLDEKLTSLLS